MRPPQDNNEKKDWLALLAQYSYPTPFQLFHINKLQANIQTLKKFLPRVEVFYAIKSASSPEIIQAIDDLVDGYDIASLGEYKMLKKENVAASRVLYSNPVKIPEHIRKAYKEGVDWFALDSHSEITKLATNAPNANVYLRLKVSDYGSKFPLSKKFGVDPLHAVMYAGEAQEQGLQVRGIAFHVGSQSENPQTWDVALKACGDTIQRLAGAGIQTDFVNIGGGFPVEYTNKIPSMEEAAKVINRSIDKYLPSNVRIVSEPGRYISADASVIATTIIGREHRGNEEWLFLDMGVFQGLMEPLEMAGWKYPVFTDQDPHKMGTLQPYVLTGPSCDAYDTIGFDYMLPSNLRVGDKLYIGMAGAYTTVYGSNFNGFDPPAKYFTE